MGMVPEKKKISGGVATCGLYASIVINLVIMQKNLPYIYKKIALTLIF